MSTRNFGQWTADPNLAEALEGRYQLLGELELGFPWTIFSARSSGGELLHLHLRPGWDRDPVRLRRFLSKQLASYGQIQHPQMVPLLDCGGNWCYLWWVTPPLPGPSLRCRLQQSLPGLTLVKEWLEQLLLALDVLHRADVIHPCFDLDAICVKEQKLWLQIPIFQPMEEPLDASSGFLDAIGPSLTSLAPEVVFRGQMGVASNYFSLGSLLYELLTAQPAFAGNDAIEVLGALAAGRGPDCSTLPSPFDRLIPRLLEPDPEKRLCQPELLKSQLL